MTDTVTKTVASENKLQDELRGERDRFKNLEHRLQMLEIAYRAAEKERRINIKRKLIQ